MFRSLYDPAQMPELVTRILRAFPIAHVWDDHDYGANNTNRTWKFRDQANQAFREYTPAYSLPAPSLKGIWQRFTYGALAEFFLLDLRSQRDRNTDDDNEFKSMLEGDPIGDSGQLKWLKDGLRDSAATWKFVLSTVSWNPTAKKGTPGHYDNWAGFTNEQNALIGWIAANGIKNVVILSGDAHMGALDNGFWAVYPEMVTPAANFTGATPYSCDNLDERGNWSAGTYPPVPGPAVCNGYSTVRVTELDLVLTVKDDAGNVKLQMTISRQ
jgi:alkaline phosphatase D